MLRWKKQIFANAAKYMQNADTSKESSKLFSCEEGSKTRKLMHWILHQKCLRNKDIAQCDTDKQLGSRTVSVQINIAYHIIYLNYY